MSENFQASRYKNRYIGQEFQNNIGQKFKIIEYKNSNDVTIQFEDGTIRYGARMPHIRSGKISKFKTLKNNSNNVKENNSSKYLNKEFINNDGDKFTVIKYNGSYDCTIQFEDGTIREKVIVSNIKAGTVKHPNHKHIFYDKYIVGEGKYSFKETPDIYNIWFNMITRCSNKIKQLDSPTYIDCSVDKRWWNLQEFGKWYDENYIEGFELDKDILHKGNKIYGPDTCCFVPQEINILFVKANAKRGNYPIGVTFDKSKNTNPYIAQMALTYIGCYDTVEKAFQAYKEVKEYNIKLIANKWKDKISEKVYKALMNYKVEITD